MSWVQYLVNSEKTHSTVAISTMTLLTAVLNVPDLIYRSDAVLCNSLD